MRVSVRRCVLAVCLPPRCPVGGCLVYDIHRWDGFVTASTVAVDRDYLPATSALPVARTTTVAWTSTVALTATIRVPRAAVRAAAIRVAVAAAGVVTVGARFGTSVRWWGA